MGIDLPCSTSEIDSLLAALATPSVLATSSAPRPATISASVSAGAGLAAPVPGGPAEDVIAAAAIATGLAAAEDIVAGEDTPAPLVATADAATAVATAVTGAEPKVNTHTLRSTGIWTPRVESTL